MARTTSWRNALAAALLAGAALGCEEQVTAPGRCPDFCPADTIQLQDTVLTGVVVGDTSIRGFTETRDMPIFVTSSVPGARARAVVRFRGLPERWFPSQGDTLSVRVGSLDSVAVELRLQQRDTTVTGLRVLVFRLPRTLDTTATFANTDSLFHDSLIVDSILVPDSLRVGALVRGLIVPPVITPADTTDTLDVTLGLAIRADAPTSASFNSSQSVVGGVPLLRVFARGLAPRDTFTTVFLLAPTHDTYFQDPVPPTPPDNFIIAGNQPAARALLRFTLPTFIDSAVLIRATLLLRLSQPAAGRGHETFRLEVAPVIKDFGGKSILVGDTLAYGVGTVTVGDTGLVSIEMVNVLSLWRGINVDSLPRVVILRNTDEGTSIEEILAFGSSSAAANQPRLHLTYARPLRFGVP